MKKSKTKKIDTNMTLLCVIITHILIERDNCMKKYLLKIIFASVASVTLFSGCTGPGASPYGATQAGAATGAIAGSVIGYNTKGHHRGQRAVIGGLIGAGIGAGVGNAIDSQYQEPVQTGGWQ